MLLVTLTLAISGSVLAQDYCKITKEHTMCKYKGHGPECHGEPLRRGVSAEEQQVILDIHNRLRSRIATGKERRGKPGPQPGASNMKFMIWDEELARIAQRHADQCKFAHDCASCRKTSRFGVGQNLFIYKQTLKPPPNNWVSAVTDWYDEVELFNNKDVEPFQFSTATGHYTQVVWHNTDKVGCGATSFRDGKWFATLYTCNYGPNGNFIRSQMYKQGPPCSDCDKGESCSTEFEGLCVKNQSKPVAGNTTDYSDLGKGSIKTKDVSKSKKIVPTPAPTRPPTTKTTTTTTTTATTTIRAATTTPRASTVRRTTRIPNARKNNRGSRPTSRRTTKKPRRVTSPSTSNKTRDKVDKQEVARDGQVLFTCDFKRNERNCVMKDRGKTWQLAEEGSNQYKEVELFSRDTAEFYFKQLIKPPASTLACLDFRFKKYSSDGSSNQLTVLAWPYRGKPGKVAIEQESPDLSTWVRAQVTFKNVDRDFLLMLRARGPRARGAKLTLAVDRVRVTAGRCEE